MAGGRPETSKMESGRERDDIYVNDQSNVVEIMTREAINEAAMHGQLQQDSDDEDDGNERMQPVSGSDRNPYSSRNSSPGNDSEDSEQATHQQMQQLFAYTSEYQPEAIELFPELKCFIPDYIPAIGDIDPMIKVFHNVINIQRYLLRPKKSQKDRKQLN